MEEIKRELSNLANARRVEKNANKALKEMLDEVKQSDEYKELESLRDHAQGDMNHRDVQFGFVTSQTERHQGYFVRYWKKGEEGRELRTTAGSELTPDRLLVKHKIVVQERVDKLLALIKAGD